MALPDAVLAIQRLRGIDRAGVERGGDHEALDGRPGLQLVLHGAMPPHRGVAARLVRVERGIGGKREHGAALHVHHRHPSGGRAGGGDRARKLALGGELDGGVDGQRHGGAGEVGRIRRSLRQHRGAARVAHRLDGDGLATQPGIELAFQPFLAALLSHEAEHVPGQRPLRVEALRLLHHLDAVEPQPGDARGRLLVHPPLEPHEALLAGQPGEDLCAIGAQGTGEQPGGNGALPGGGEGGGIGEDRVHVPRHGQRRAAAVRDRPAPRGPLDLAPGLVAGEPRQPGPVEELHLGRPGEHHAESREQRHADQRRADPHPPSGSSSRAAPLLVHRPLLLGRDRGGAGSQRAADQHDDPVGRRRAHVQA